MPNEADVKRDMVKKIKEEGGYGRRIEDQYAVGLPDLIMIPAGGPVFFVEVKIIRAQSFGATPRQLEELKRITAADGFLHHAITALIGYGGNTKRLYISEPTLKTKADGLLFAERPWNITDLLKTYWQEQMLKRATSNDGKP